MLADLGVNGVRVRGINPGDQPRVEELGTPDRPLPKVLGILTRDGVLMLPRARFRLRDRAKLSEYLARLEGEGAAGVTTDRGNFGLTLAQFETVFVALGEPIGPIDQNAPLLSVAEQAAAAAQMPLNVEARARAALLARPTTTKVAPLSRGTALAILLRAEGLVLRPEKPIGKPVWLTIAPAYDDEQESWPIGYQPEQSPRDAAPVLMKSIPVEVAGFTLTEALAAIEPRLEGLPILFDDFALRRDAIDPTTVQVELARTKTFYKRILQRLAFQARLKTELKVDEAGTPFVWLTR